MPVVLRPELEDSYGFLGQALVLKQDGSNFCYHDWPRKGRWRRGRFGFYNLWPCSRCPIILKARFRRRLHALEMGALRFFAIRARGSVA